METLTIKFIEDIRDHEYEVIQLHGNLDAHTLPIATRKMDEHLPKTKLPFLIFDFSDCPFINSNGIGFLMEIHMKLTKRKQQLIVAGVQANVKDILELVGMPKIVPVFDTIAQAIDHIKKRK
ncbi:hypothetical protein COV82_06410 [Candidatus Peregrinibacteria bacterium CG11_big_fil_rev_8_21_14_0_20_46_8]|nr:MAG: hypothetical protein COV82_06410 [Candidatus Peregrinibacteria bacterium CG11_big_fil_rev_8_21_14_0_20_46_8]